MRRIALALIALGTGLLAVPTHADASTVSKAAWWYKARTGDPTTAVPPNAGPIPGGVPTAPPPPTPGPPTVPEGSLLVEGTPQGATAIAGLTYAMSSDESASVLTITPSTSSQVPADAVILACRAAIEWAAPDQNPGAWEEKPLVSCDQSVQGIIGDDKTITFALGPLCISCSTLDVILVPGTVAPPAATPEPTGSTFSLSFSKDDGATLTTSSAGATSDASSSYSPSTAVDVAPASPAYSAPSAFSTAPVPIAQPALEPQEQAPTVPQQAALPAVTPVKDDRTGQGVGFLVLLAGLACAGLAYVTPARAEDGTVGLGRFRRPVPAALATAPVEPISGGLGRFARPRTGPPPALS